MLNDPSTIAIAPSMAQTVTVLTSFNRRKEQVNKVANLVIKITSFADLSNYNRR